MPGGEDDGQGQGLGEGLRDEGGLALGVGVEDGADAVGFQGLPSVDPAWVLKIDRTSGALLGVVRLLDATLLPERQPWEWRQNVYDRILWRAPVPAPVSASAEWLEAARRRDTVLLYGPLDAGAVTPAEWEAGAATPPDWERLVSVHAYCQFTDRM
ncbi:hypothetical protein ABK046_33740 [Streptomyces caeruleatus]